MTHFVIVVDTALEQHLGRHGQTDTLSVGVFLEASLKADASAAEFLEDAPTRHGFDGLVLSRKR